MIHISKFNNKEINQKINNLILSLNNRVEYFSNIDYFELDKILKKTHFIYIPHYFNKNYRDDTSTGSIQLSYNYLARIIFPDNGYSDAYKLKTPLEYHPNLNLEKLIDFEMIESERKK